MKKNCFSPTLLNFSAKKNFFISALFLLGVIFSTSADAEEQKVSMDFVNVDIAVVVKYMSELTDRNFIIDEKVRGKVTIISPKMVTKDEAYKVFESILETYGFIAVEAGSAVKIMPVAEARQKAGAVRIGARPTKDMRDNMITQLIPLKYVSAGNLVNVLRPLIPSTSYIVAYSPTNMLILVDLAGNRTRILKVIQQLDVEGFESSVTVRHMRYASARDIADKVDAILNPKGSKKPNMPSKVIADERINAIVIIGNDLYVSKVKNLVNQLDIESPPGRDELHVVYLKNADAEELAKVINNITKSVINKKGRKGKKTGSARKGTVEVVADKFTNALLITASPENFATLENIIKKLDVRRRQVFVEALIMEIRTDDTSKFGIEWRTTSNFNDSGVQGFGGTNFGNINSAAQNPLNTGAGLTLGVVDGTIKFGEKTFINLGGLMTALRTEAGVNILSTPNILTTDNVEAEIFVGENVPFVKSSAQTTGATPITNIERKDVGITLRVKPQINEDNYVKLDIYQEISSINKVQLAKASDIITFERRAQTTVTVKNKQNIIIGGLIRDDSQENISKVPLLGDIPLLGWLFKSKETVAVKNNLLIFLTPHIINSDEDMETLTKRRREDMRKMRGREDMTGGEENKDIKEAPTAGRPNIPAGNIKKNAEAENKKLKLGKVGREKTLFEAEPEMFAEGVM